MSEIKTFLLGLFVVVTSPIWLVPFALYCFCSEIYDVGQDCIIRWKRWRGVPAVDREWEEKVELIKSLGPIVHPTRKGKNV